MDEWSLDVLYKGYYDEASVNDFKKMDTVIQHCTQAAGQSCHDNEVKTLHDALPLLKKSHAPAGRVGHFISLKQSTSTSDGKTISLMSQFLQKFSGVTKTNTRFSRYVAETEGLGARIEQDALLKEYSYLLHIIKEDSTYLLNDDVEDVLFKINISDGETWASLRGYLTSVVEVKYKDEISILSQIRSMTYSSDARVRKSVYEIELKACDKIHSVVAFSLNSIKAQILIECELRGLASPLTVTLYDTHMGQETLGALLHTM